MNAHCVFSITKTGDICLTKGQELDRLLNFIINYKNKKGEKIVISKLNVDGNFPRDYWIFY